MKKMSDSISSETNYDFEESYSEEHSEVDQDDVFVQESYFPL